MLISDILNYFPIYATFSILALVAKGVLFYYQADKLRKANCYVLLFLAGLVAVNLLELYRLLYKELDLAALLALKAYYVSMLLASSMLLLVILRMFSQLARQWVFIVTLALVTVSSLIVFSDSIVAGVVSLGYSLTRDPGAYYWIFEVHFLTLISIYSGFLLWQIKYQSDAGRRLLALTLLLATTPMILTAVSVIVLMEMGVAINGTVVGSFSILLFVLALLITGGDLLADGETFSEERLRRLLAMWPFTREYRLTDQVRTVLLSDQNKGLQQSVEDYEKMLVLKVLDECGGNKSAAAKKLGISRPTLMRKLRNP